MAINECVAVVQKSLLMWLKYSYANGVLVTIKSYNIQRNAVFLKLARKQNWQSCEYFNDVLEIDTILHSYYFRCEISEALENSDFPEKNQNRSESLKHTVKDFKIGLAATWNDWTYYVYFIFILRLRLIMIRWFVRVCMTRSHRSVGDKVFLSLAIREGSSPIIFKKRFFFLLMFDVFA